MNERLYRSATDRVFTGLCGGLAEHFDVDSTLIRILWVILGILSGIFPLLIAYVVIALIVPEEPVPGRGPWPSWGAPPWGPPAPGAAPVPDAGSEPGAGATAGTTSGVPSGEGAGGTAPGGPASGPWGPWGPPPPPGADWRTARAYARAQRRAERAYWRSQHWGGDASSAGIVFGLILVVLGGVVLLQQTVPGFDAALVWPALLIVIGALLLVGAFRH